MFHDIATFALGCGIQIIKYMYMYCHKGVNLLFFILLSYDLRMSCAQHHKSSSQESDSDTCWT